ncbi:TPA: TIGR02646 family protein [Candidatus Sumerlaeota bacterium]|jgi:uncharacterized protein (TIGR02646 family)|nr:TIGR02646 family protein [Candidatus Sumerlaeota bacterium]
MRAIDKRPTPIELALYPDANYDGPNFTPVKDKIREQLLEEQGHLCAYCMQRITKSSMKVEHWHSQAKHDGEQLDYANMLGCCTGGQEEQPPQNQHCDTKKGNRDISYNPSNPHHVQRMKISYLANGTIGSEDSRFDEEINAVLNLNWARLKENRKSVWKSVEEALSRKSGPRSEKEIRNLITRWNRRDVENHLQEYCGVAVYFLEKRLRRCKSA